MAPARCLGQALELALLGGHPAKGAIAQHLRGYLAEPRGHLVVLEVAVALVQRRADDGLRAVPQDQSPLRGEQAVFLDLGVIDDALAAYPARQDLRKGFVQLSVKPHAGLQRVRCSTVRSGWLEHGFAV